MPRSESYTTKLIKKKITKIYFSWKCASYIVPCWCRAGNVVTDHGVRFPRARLTVRKYCTIVAGQHFVDQWWRHIVIHFRLLGFGSKRPIKCEFFRWMFVKCIFDKDFTCRWHFDHFMRSNCAFPFICWSNKINDAQKEFFFCCYDSDSWMEKMRLPDAKIHLDILICLATGWRRGRFHWVAGHCLDGFASVNNGQIQLNWRKIVGIGRSILFFM